MVSTAPQPSVRKTLTFEETKHGHRPAEADTRCVQGPTSNADLLLYVSAPQDNRTAETHAQHATTLSLIKFDLFFERAFSSLQHEERKDGTDKLPSMYNSNPLQ